MSTAAPSIWDAAVSDAVGKRPTGAQAPGAQAATSDIWGAAVNDALGKKPPAAPMDKSYAAAQFPQLQTDDLSHTLYNMTAAMSGQKLATPEDEVIGQQGKQAGFEAAGVTALTSLGGELLAAPKLLQVAARDPATGQFVRGLATQEGPTLLAQGVKAVQAAGEAHPLVKQALIQGLTMLGAGKIAHMLGWLGKMTE